MPTWIDSIVPVGDGELVNQSVTNRSVNAIVNNLLYLKSIVDGGAGASVGPAIVSRGQRLSSSTAVGTPVWYNDATLQYEPAQAVAVQDPATSALVLGPQANCVGVVVAKSTTTLGDVLLAGQYAVDVVAAVGSPVTAGRYYLSAAAAGFLTKTRPPITVSVLYADGAGGVYVLPQIRDFFLGDHVHYNFDLVPEPAGATVPPAHAGLHTVTSPDTGVAGWLPAGHAIFNGLAPAGAKFGYNVSADAQLQAVWPPIPLTAYSVTVTKFNASALVSYADLVTLDFSIGPQGSAGPQGPGSIGSQGVQGAQGPPGSVDSWELAVPIAQAEIGDDAFAQPEQQLPKDLVWDAYVVTPGYVNVRLGTLTGAPVEIPPVLWEVGVVKPGAGATAVNPVGLVSIDANGIWWLSDCYGDAPWPTDLDTTVVGPAPTPADCPRDPNAMSINLAFSRLSFGTAQAQVTSLAPAADSPVTVRNAAGGDATAGALYLGLKLNRELDARVNQLSGVVEANAGFHYWSFPAGTAATLRGEVEVPALYVGANPSVQLRLLLYGTAFGTLGNLTLSCRRLPRPGGAPGTPATPPAADTTVALTTAYPVQAGQYVEALSAAIAVAAGDVLVFNLGRGTGDGYAGDIGLVRAQGVLASS